MVINKISVLGLLSLQQPIIDANAQQCHQRHYFGRCRYFNIVVTSNSRLDGHRHDLHAALHLIFRSSLAAHLLFLYFCHTASFLFNRSGLATRLRRLRIQHLEDTQLPRPRHIAMYQRRTAPHDDQHHRECNQYKDLSNSLNHSSSVTLSIKFSAAKIVFFCSISKKKLKKVLFQSIIWLCW